MTTETLPKVGIKTLSIRDFRGIERLDLDFSGPDGHPNPLVVLAGPNGSGKTAVLEAALIAVGGSALATGPLGERAVRSGAIDYRIEGSTRVVAPILDNELPFNCTSESGLPPISPLIPVWYFSSWRAPSLVGAVNVSIGKGGRQRKRNDSNRLLNIKQKLANAAATQNFPGARSPIQKYAIWIERINEAWAIFYPHQDEQFFVGLVDPDEEGNGSFELFLGRPNASPLTVDFLSAGQLELFLFVAALVLNDQEEGIIFIDEPELHLDPQWHAPILRALMRLQPAAQFIVATHSPAIFNSAMSFERHFLVDEDDPRARIWGQASARS